LVKCRGVLSSCQRDLYARIGADGLGTNGVQEPHFVHIAPRPNETSWLVGGIIGQKADARRDAVRAEPFRNTKGQPNEPKLAGLALECLPGEPGMILLGLLSSWSAELHWRVGFFATASAEGNCNNDSENECALHDFSP
jgi:hypothetical protein